MRIRVRSVGGLFGVAVRGPARAWGLEKSIQFLDVRETVDFWQCKRKLLVNCNLYSL